MASLVLLPLVSLSQAVSNAGDGGRDSGCYYGSFELLSRSTISVNNPLPPPPPPPSPPLPSALIVTRASNKERTTFLSHLPFCCCWINYMRERERLSRVWVGGLYSVRHAKSNKETKWNERIRPLMSKVVNHVHVHVHLHIQRRQKPLLRDDGERERECRVTSWAQIPSSESGFFWPETSGLRISLPKNLSHEGWAWEEKKRKKKKTTTEH